MTRKDFKLLARTVARISRPTARKIMADRMGRELETTNHRFDWGLWYKDCGVFSEPTTENTDSGLRRRRTDVRG